MAPGRLGDAHAAEHARDLRLSRRRVEVGDRRDRGAGARFLRDAELPARVHGDLRQVRDAEHLAILPELLQMLADDLGDGASPLERTSRSAASFVDS